MAKKKKFKSSWYRPSYLNMSKSDLIAVNEAMQRELASARPSEAVLAACALFKVKAERTPDVTIPPEGLDEKDLPWWIK